MRGEYTSWRTRAPANSGSSPHAWGIQILGRKLALDGRFIPTCVGNTHGSRRSRIYPPVHPHMRGEYSKDFRHALPEGGSSPHAWGIPIGKLMHDVDKRFIPTCVGNTSGRRPRKTPGPVHPHMRGEYSVLEVWKYPPAGSSPHAWGIPSPAGGWAASCRFIPTCVGNTLPENMKSS